MLKVHYPVTKRKVIILTIKIYIAFATFISGVAWGDSQGNYPRNWVVSSENNDYSFTMLRGLGDQEEPRGFAVRHLDDGSDSIYWSTSGWYGFNGYLTPNGNHLITHADNKILVNRSDVENIEVLRFQHKGKLLRAYTLGDLVVEVGELRKSTSHIYWMAQALGYPLYGLEGNEFTLVTAEKNRFVFDVRDGSISFMERADDVRTIQETKQAKFLDAKYKGMKLYNSSDIKIEYDSKFTVSEKNSKNGVVGGVHFKGQQWTANLLPLDDSLKRCNVRAVFPRQGNKRLIASIKANEIIQACHSVLSNAYLRNRFGIGNLKFRIRITGDRLHWDTDELLERLSETNRQLERGQIPVYWAEVIITTNDPDNKYFSFYLNTQTGDMVFGDQKTKYPYTSIYVRAD